MQHAFSPRPTLFEETLAAHLQARDGGVASGPDTLFDLWPDMAAELEDFLALEEGLLRGLAPPRRGRLGDGMRGRGTPAATRAQAPPGPGVGPSPADARALGPGSVCGPCRLEEELAAGRFGRRFRATQLLLRRPVTLEVIEREQARAEGLRARLALHLRLQARLDHPASPGLHGVEGAAGRLWIISQPSWGRSLAASRQGGGLTPREWLGVARSAAAALAHARERGVLLQAFDARHLILREGGGVLLVGAELRPLTPEARKRRLERTDLLALGRALWPYLRPERDPQ